MKTLLFCLSFCLGACCLAAQNTTPSTAIYFATGSAELDAQALTTLSEVAAQLTSYPDYRFELVAHTDSRGQANFNLQLAQARAQAVSNWFRQQGLAADQFQVQALGEAQAGSDRGSAERLRQNRRVDISVAGWAWSELSTLQDSLARSLTQYLRIDADQDASWRGRAGGQFYLPAGSLVDAQGKVVSGAVDLQLVEAYSLSDMLKAGLTTQSPQGVLQTGGMFYWEARQQGQALSLTPGATLDVGVPTDNFRQDMRLFYGDGHADTPPASWENSTAPVSNRFPRLQLAEQPKRPARTHYIRKFLKVERPPVTEDPRYPTAPTMARPRKPHEPAYDRIAYRPSGIEKLTMSKQKRAALSEQMQEKKRSNYAERLARYKARKPLYDSLMQDYQRRCQAFEVKWANEVDAEGTLRPAHPHFSTLQAQADSLFALRLAKHQKDSMAYERYRENKLAEYERRVATFELKGNTDATSLQTYFMSVNRMGWANIDRFMKLDPVTPILAYEAEPATGSDALVFLLFPERNIILRMPNQGAAQYALQQVPVGEKAKVIAVKVAENRAYLAQKQFVVSPQSSIALEFAPSRLRDIRLAMEDI